MSLDPDLKTAVQYLQDHAHGMRAVLAVADAVKAAVATAPAASGACVTGRSSTFDPETGQDGTVLAVEWWV